MADPWAEYMLIHGRDWHVDDPTFGRRWLSYKRGDVKRGVLLLVPKAMQVELWPRADVEAPSFMKGMEIINTITGRFPLPETIKAVQFWYMSYNDTLMVKLWGPPLPVVPEGTAYPLAVWGEGGLFYEDKARGAIW